MVGGGWGLSNHLFMPINNMPALTIGSVVLIGGFTIQEDRWFSQWSSGFRTAKTDTVYECRHWTGRRQDLPFAWHQHCRGRDYIWSNKSGPTQHLVRHNYGLKHLELTESIAVSNGIPAIDGWVLILTTDPTPSLVWRGLWWINNWFVDVFTNMTAVMITSDWVRDRLVVSPSSGSAHSQTRVHLFFGLIRDIFDSNGKQWGLWTESQTQDNRRQT